jgi:hypothetical protein
MNGCEIFSATMARERDGLGGKITKWLRENPDKHIVEKQVRQSSDREFHCLTIVFFYEEKAAR